MIMEDKQKDVVLNKMMAWCWKIFKRRLSPDATLFEEGDMLLRLSSKYIPLDAQMDIQTKRIKEFPCGIANCSQVFNSVSKYEDHYNSCHRNVCKMCHRIFPSGHLLEIHILETHDVMFALQAEKQDMYQCLLEHCLTKFKDTVARRNHMVKVHKYPSNYRYDRHKQNKQKSFSTQKKKEPSHKGELVAMETEPFPVAVPDNREEDQFEPCQTSSGRIFSYKVPKDISFGHGVSRGFLGGRGRGKNQKKKHWYNKDQMNMDTTVDIESVNMSDLSSALN